MRWTNPGFDSLTREEQDRQYEVLEPLYAQLSAELFESRVYGRALTSPARVLNDMSLSFPGENTTLLPWRRTVSNYPYTRYHQLRVDVGLKDEHSTPQDIGNFDVVDALFLNRSYPTFALGISARHAQPNGFEQSGFEIGVETPAVVVSALGIQSPRLPVQGFEQSDVDLVSGQLQRVAAFIAEHRLTAVDSITLGYGRGQLIVE